MYRLNFVTAYTIARLLYLKMRDQDGGGQIVFIGSLPALQPGQAKNMIAYSLAKSLVFRLSEVINEEGKEANVAASVPVGSCMDPIRFAVGEKAAGKGSNT